MRIKKGPTLTHASRGPSVIGRLLDFRKTKVHVPSLGPGAQPLDLPPVPFSNGCCCRLLLPAPGSGSCPGLVPARLVGGALPLMAAAVAAAVVLRVSRPAAGCVVAGGCLAAGCLLTGGAAAGAASAGGSD